jgi:hypothetical protein
MQSDGDYVQCRPEADAPELDAHEMLADRARRFLYGKHGPYEQDILQRQPGRRARVVAE